MVENNRLSIITINRNNAAGLRRTMESVFAQTCHDFEYIIIDGASTDGSVDIIREYETLVRSSVRPFAITWTSESDTGIYDGMNRGILKANGKYLLFMNSGDVLANDEVIANWLSHDIHADIVSCNAIFEKSRYHKEQLIISPPVAKAQHLILSFLPHQATFIRRQLFEDIHLYDTSFRAISDWLLFIEAILVHHASYQHIHMFVARCETEGLTNRPDSGKLIDEEFQRGLQKVLPLYYDVFADLRKSRKINSHPYNQYVQQFAGSSCMHFLWGLRKRLTKWGYFRLKAKIKQRQFYACLKREDAAKKKEIAKQIEQLPLNMLHRNNDASDIIVSLTSYGHRLEDVAPYAIYSIFCQSHLPNRIVLWLDNEHWNDENLPPLIKRLKKSGLEVYYCEDIKSYKKLLPSLKKFPDNPIIVIDDDSYYDRDLVKWLVEAYEHSDKRTVFATCANIPEKRKGKYIPYAEWKSDKFADIQTEVALIGCGGGIYPPGIFDEEIFNKDVFMSLAPTADDLWFWVQEKRMGVPVRLTRKHGYNLLQTVNRIEDYDISNVDNLTRTNVVHGGNEVQFKNIVNYYQMD